MNFDKTIQMYIFDGDPNGRIMCELSNWNGRVYKISRNELSNFSKREDSENTGVYFLFGKDDDGETVYIGEAEKIVSRLKQHLKDSAYWNDCVVIISKDNLLNKAHAKHLEHEFYAMAVEANRYKVINSTIPTRSSISEYDTAMLEEFISNAKLLVNTLGYKTFETLESVSESEKKEKYYYIKASRGADATGVIVSDGFAVLKGSTIAGSTVRSFPAHWQKLRTKLIEDKTINSSNVFVKDYVFSSPSAAAAVVMGRSANGQKEWKNEGNKSLSICEIENAIFYSLSMMDAE